MSQDIFLIENSWVKWQGHPDAQTESDKVNHVIVGSSTTDQLVTKMLLIFP